MTHRTIRRHQPLHFVEHVTLTFAFLHLSPTFDGDFRSSRRKNPARLASNDRPSSARIRAFRALKEKGISIIAEFQESRDRSLEVSSQLGIHGHDISGL